LNPDNHIDEFYMQRCLQLAVLGQRFAAPNPMVGSVIVHNGQIIGEGYHHKCGEAHAEVNSINSVKNPELLPESTLYVNLEPCAHVGRTPACSTLIINKKIKRVVIGCLDPFEKVAGKGIEMLRKAGVEVLVGVLDNQSRHLNRRFFTFHQKKRPYIILKWAQTQDGFIDHLRRENQNTPAWITNELSRALVHKWRTEEAGIWVGTHTVLKDNPQLNVRAWSGRNPVRITADVENQLNRSHHILDDSQASLIFGHSTKQVFLQTEFPPIDKSLNYTPQMLEELYRREIQSVIVEGGKEILDYFISNNLWDEARVFIGPVLFNEGISAPIFDFQANHTEHIEGTVLNWYYNQ